jgi:putative radical SAM enzyme (TIGR03279 family)
VIPGDILLSIDGQEVADVFDYRMRELNECLTLEVEHEDGNRSTVFIEKDEDEELGLVFSEPLLDRPKSCANQCVFCFIDQLPKGMRPTLYFKDDDPRLCFLDGNFITLTNIDDPEFARLLSYRLSPLNVSVHTSDPELRVKMMNNRFAGNVMERLKTAVESGVSLNCQIVLCPGINDGPALERTVSDLLTLGESLLSIAVVPVGLTRYRDVNGLPELRPYDRDTANAVLDYVHGKQREFKRTLGRRLFYAADEFYIRAGRPIPPAARYDEFYQLENGVGLLAARRKELHEEVSRLRKSKRFTRRHPEGLAEAGGWLLISGMDAAPFTRGELERSRAVLGSVPEVLPVSNRFFGENVTVTGLLTGQDILAAVRERISRSLADKALAAPRGILLPDVTLRAGEHVFLDDTSVETLSSQSSLPVKVWETSGRGLIDALLSIEKIREPHLPGREGSVQCDETKRGNEL